ncbi:MAG: hypothetical protein K0S76_967 [Herbinix sp.]|jgi:ABC-type multidrug transport system ATPase subunit|nr:hypothetical protein [Herbinix sp.]
MELIIDCVSKHYGAKKALDSFSLKLTPGIYGLLGPNGAGKSTLMNIIVGNIRQDSGDVLYNGKSIRVLDKEFRQLLGFMPQQQTIYNEFTALDFLRYIAALKGVKRPSERIMELLELLNLTQDANKKLGGFSGGMKQRILIAQALLNQPKILILDEPTAGLDPKERIRLRNLIAETALGSIVILATHVVQDIEFISKEVALLKEGKLVASEPVGEIIKRAEGKVYEVVIQGETIPQELKSYKLCNIAKYDDSLIIRFLCDVPPGGFELTQVRPSLEDLYLYTFDR